MNKDKVALITGGSKRIGAVITRYFHKKGFKVIIHFNKSIKHADELKKELLKTRKNSCLTLQADFLNKDSLIHSLNEFLENTRKLDVLVNNASSFFPTSIESASRDEWINLLTTNAEVPFFLIQSLKPLLEENNGCVINISDSLVSSGIKKYRLYTAAKAALESLTKSLAKELAPKVRVNGVAPGVILWPEKNNLSKEEKQKILDKTSLGRLGTSEDIAAAVYFLTNASYITGQTLKVDGGRSSV